MDFKSQQEQFDKIKWYDSIVAGCDRCGSYEFCAVCDKAEEYPCAHAAYRNKQSVQTPIATIRLRVKKRK